MKHLSLSVMVAVIFLCLSGLVYATSYNDHDKIIVELGSRPLYLVENMEAGALKDSLLDCAGKPAGVSAFSIGHRGAPMQFPEHTRESYIAAARMGAGILECDVTFTRDKELVCRHSQCDLHTTTNILQTPLAEKCSVGFTPAILSGKGKVKKRAKAKCCTSDITLAEFRTLNGKMDEANRSAKTVEEFVASTGGWRSALNASIGTFASTGTLMTHKESIALFKELGTKMIPELKAPKVDMPYEKGFTQQAYAQKMVDEYKALGISPDAVFLQSTNADDIEYWLENEPEFGQQAVLLDDWVYPNKKGGYERAIARLPKLAAKGVRYVAPPMFALVAEKDGKIAPSSYAKAANQAGLSLITWTLERSGPLVDGGGWYFEGVNHLISNDGATYDVLDVLAQDVGIKGIFSDWPATVTYYANCKGL